MRKQKKPSLQILLWARASLPLLTIFAVGALYFAIGVEFEPYFDWTGIRPEIIDSVKRVSQADFTSSGVVGIAGKRPQQFDRRKWLMKEASDSELERLMKYPNGTVKAVAYEGLLWRMPDVAFEIVKEAFSDTISIVHYRSGCTGWPYMMGEHLMVNVLHLTPNGPPQPPGHLAGYSLSEYELSQLHKLYLDCIYRKDGYMSSLY